MTRKLQIDFVSDIACPWCAIGVHGLDRALDDLKGEIDAEVAFHPFELNPDMLPESENGLEHVARKYGISPNQVRANRTMIRDRAAAVGFAMNTTDDSRAWNTFDGHRLIAWAGERGRQAEMKQQMLKLFFTDQRDPNDRDALAAAADAAGLDGNEARAVLASDRYADQVRSEESAWRARGINSVPAVVVDGRYLISGGLPPEEYARQLRAIAARSADEPDTE